MDKKEVLVVEREAVSLRTLTGAVKDAGYLPRSTNSSIEALEMLRQNDRIGLVITDRNAPGVNGEELFVEAKEILNEVPFIFLSACDTIGSVVELMKKGAFYCVEKPVDRKLMKGVVEKALKSGENEKSVKNKGIGGLDGYHNIIGRHKKIRDVFEIIKTVAGSDVTVLVQGDSGVGKELVARALHENSQRSGRKMIVLNCAVLPENLLESELFGHMKGTFTGAIADRPGKFEIADKSTVFLDEIGDMPLHLQVKLLRFLQEREFERVGGREVIKTDVRIIAATNLDLLKQVDDGKFRLDLYYRLNVIPIYMPSLREREDDIILLANHFLKNYMEKNDKKLHFSKDACKVLMSYSWPGNVRELENVVQQMVVLCQNEEIQVSDLPLSVQVGEEETCEVPMDGFSLPDKVAKIERRWIENALRQTQWNRSKTAKILGITRKVLFSKMKKNNINVPK